MSERPPAESLLLVMFAPRTGQKGDRLSPSSVAKRHMIGKWRCEKRAHLLAFVVATQYGEWVAWRTLRSVADRPVKRDERGQIFPPAPEEITRTRDEPRGPDVTGNSGWDCRWRDECGVGLNQVVYDPCRRQFGVDFTEHRVFGPENQARMQ